MANFNQGAQVEHQKFGLGTVLASSDERIVIKFDDHGEKKFVTDDGRRVAEEKRSSTTRRKARLTGPQTQSCCRRPRTGLTPKRIRRLNARQKRLFEESLKKNPNLKMPSEASQSARRADRRGHGAAEAGRRRQERASAERRGALRANLPKKSRRTPRPGP